jgi:hypothetical protein
VVVVPSNRVVCEGIERTDASQFQRPKYALPALRYAYAGFGYAIAGLRFANRGLEYAIEGFGTQQSSDKGSSHGFRGVLGSSKTERDPAARAMTQRRVSARQGQTWDSAQRWGEPRLLGSYYRLAGLAKVIAGLPGFARLDLSAVQHSIQN